MVGVTKIQRGNAGYWIEAVAEGGDDYYTKPGEAPGEWIGSLADDLGLIGQVDRDSYTAILAGTDPTTDTELLRRPKPRSYVDSAGRQRTAEPVLGYDVRFAAPKSISLAYGLGAPELRAAILRAHDEAVAQGFAYLEQNAALVQRGRNGIHVERGAGLVGMAFRHRMSRAGDPALHTHVVISNLTRATSDDSWLTLASPKGRSPFYLHAKAAGFVYQAALRRAVVRDLGLHWGPVTNGYADLRAFGRDVIDFFSKRRGEIVADMAARGTSSAKAAEVSAYRTRDAKDYGVDEDTRRSEWIAQAQEFDLGPDALDSLVSDATPREVATISGDQLTAAVRELEATRSHFDRRELICAVAGQMPDGATADDLAAAVDGALESGQLIKVNEPANLTTPTYFSTPRLWQHEQTFIKVARGGTDAGAAVVGPAVVDDVLRRHGYLGGDQREMVERLLSDGERIVPVAARPGTGKTTALTACREGWEAAGFPVQGVATARTASVELQDAGVPATSIRALLLKIESWESRGVRPLLPGTVIIVDESSTTQTVDMAELAQAVERCGGKLVLIGDPKQIGAVGPGGAYGHLTREVDPILLTTIRRQRTEAGRRIVELAHEGRGSDAIDVLRSEGQLTIADTQPDALDALALDWCAAARRGEDAVMVARRNRDVDDLNARARDLLRSDGVLAAGEQLHVGGQGFTTGDLILTRINSPQASNRERWRLIAIDAERRAIEVERVGGDGRHVILDADYLAQTTKHGEAAIQHAYAITTYAAQGKTFDSAYVLLDGGGSREEFLVAVSRSREATFAYGVAAIEFTDPEHGPGVRDLEDELHELRASAERPADDFLSAEVSVREQIADLDLGELFARRARVAYLIRQEEGAEQSPSDGRAADLEEEIGEVAEVLSESTDALRLEEAKRRPDSEVVARLGATVDRAHEQYEELTAERDRLAAAATRARTAPDPALAVERDLIAERLRVMQRREIQMERLETTPMVENALGPRPLDPDAADAWNEGVDIIYSQKYAQSSIVRRGDALGAVPPSGGQRHADHLAAELRLAEIRTQLGLADSPARTVETDFAIDL
jgi:conjugative relaxase-like TrwC/TraI family protein